MLEYLMNVELGNPVVLTGLIMVSMALVRIIERLIDNMVRRRNGTMRTRNPGPAPGCAGLTDQEHAALMRLDDLHAKYDSDGTPLWYVPRSMMASMAKLTEIQDKIAIRLRDIASTQEGVLRRLERLSESSAPPRR